MSRALGYDLLWAKGPGPDKTIGVRRREDMLLNLLAAHLGQGHHQ